MCVCISVHDVCVCVRDTNGYWVSPAPPLGGSVKVDIPGPQYVCRPAWPSFIDSLDGRETVKSYTFLTTFAVYIYTCICLRCV